MINNKKSNAMNKYLLMLFGFFVFTVVAFAGNPIVNPFLSPMRPNNAYPNDLKEYLDFQKLCISGKYKQKNIDKVKTAYEQLCRNHAENKAVAMCFMGYYLLFSENNENGMQEEGLNLISQGLEQISDTTLTSGDVRNNQKYLLCAFNQVLGYAYLKGIETAPNYDIAFGKYFMEKEYGKGSIPLGLCYLLGIGAPIDAESAVLSIGSVIPTWYSYNQMFADAEHMINTYVWNREHHPDSIATNAFRDGYLKWYIQEDFDGAKEEFLKSINLGYLPAMCELAMMNLDERWKNRNEIEFETWLQKASDAGYVAADHIMGRRYLEHWGTSVPFSSSGQGKAYPYFEKGATAGYIPSIALVKEYKKGTYSTKTGINAALSDLNEGWKSGDEDGPGLLQGLLMIGAELHNRFTSPSNKDKSANVESTGNATLSTNGNIASTSSNNSSDNSIKNSGYIRKYELRYKDWEKRASFWINSFNDAYGNLLANDKTKPNPNLSNYQRRLNDAKFELKIVLKELQMARTNAASYGGNIPKGSIEEQIEICLSRRNP